MFKRKYRTENSRRYKRLKADYLVKHHIPGFPELARVSNIKDISAGGLRFWTDQSFPEGALINLNILIPALNRQILALGRIRRVRRSPSGNVDYVAVSFIELSRDDRKALNDFIEHLATTKEAPFLIDQHPIVKRVVEV